MRVGVDDAQEPPPPLEQRHDGRRRRILQLVPTTDELSVDLLPSTSSPRPRDRMWKAERTWKGTGGHGKGKGEEVVGADPVSSPALLEEVVEFSDDLEDDREEEDPELEDRRRRRRR